MANALYLIATPIGNREDVSLRALKTLFSVETLLCEDTRKTQLLLSSYQKELPGLLGPSKKLPKLVSFFEHNEVERLPQVLSWLKQGINVGLVSNSGTPTISDPGFKLVRACLTENIRVVVIPGPSAAIAALSVSGLPTDKFLFLGFLPKKPGKRQKLLSPLLDLNLSVTVILYESPFRVQKTVLTLQKVFGNIELVMVRELTKIHESVEKHTIEEWLESFNKVKLKGEVVLLFHTKKAA